MTDFICNGLYKALATGGEGTVYKSGKDDHAPMPFFMAQLNLSVRIDEYGIDVLKVEGLESKKAATKWTQDDVADLANRRMRLHRKIRAIVDDQVPVYRPPVVLPVRDFIGVGFPKVKLEELHFLTYVTCLVEFYSTLTPPPPNHRSYITGLALKLIPLIMEARKHPYARFHLPAPAALVAFVYFWLDLLAQLDAHMNQPKFVPLRAMFKLLKQTRADRTAPIPPAVAVFADSIEQGSLFSQPFCELRNIAISLRANRTDELIVHVLDCLRLRPPPASAVFVESVSRHCPGQRLSLVKFDFANGYLSATATSLNFQICQTPIVFPQYAMLLFQPRGGPVDVGESFRTGNLRFDIGVRAFDQGEGDDGFGVNFAPGTSSTVISLEEDAI
jgi:hypothetical protein